MNLQVIEHAPRLEALESDWNKLLAASDHDSPFMSWDWMDSWWKQFGRGELKIVTLWEGPQLIAIAPFYLMAGPAGMRTLKLLGSGQSDYLDFLVRKEQAGELYTKLLEVVEKLGIWDLVQLEQVPPRRLPLIRQVFKSLGRSVQIKARGHCYGLPLPGRWDDFLAGLGPNERYNIRRRTRTLEKQFGAVFRKIAHPDEDIKGAVEAFFELMLKRLTVRGKRLAMEEATSKSFHLEVAERFARRGWLSLSMLEVHRRPIGALYAFQYNRRLLYYHSGFDPQWSKYSVGMVMLANCMEDGINRGMREFDFMRGHADYKERWRVEERPFYRVIVSRTPLGHVRYLGASLIERMGKLVRRRLGG